MVGGAGKYEFQRYLSGALVQWSSPAATESAAPAREDFLGSLLFADISGFTRLTAKWSESDRAAGAERVSLLLNAFMGELINHIEEHGGTVLSFAGDSLIAGWRAPSPEELEQTAWRSCYCAERIREQIGGPGSPEDALQLRIAVGAGAITLLHLLPRADQRWLIVGGDCLAQADHCGQLSDAGEILVSDAVWRLVGKRAKGGPNREGTARLDSIEPCSTTKEAPRTQPGSTADRLEAYLPLSLRSRLLSPLSEWLADLRTVTALFVHIVGRDLDTDLDRLNKLIERSIAVVGRTGGEILHTALHAGGLEVFAVFGLPGRKHADNARRAIIAALRLSNELDEPDLGLSAGISTGESFCGALGTIHRADYTVVGAAVNMAARLASVAAGRILVDQATAKETAGQIAFSGPWTLGVPGMRGGVVAFAPIAETVATIDNKSPILFNRAAELAVLNAYVERAGRGQAAGVMIVKGESGVGKSALLRAFVENCRDHGSQVLVGNADDIESDVPYFAWRGVIRDLLGIGDLRGPEASDQVMQFFAHRPELAHLAPLLNDAINLTLTDTVETRAMSGDGRSHRLRELLRDLMTDSLSWGRGVVVLEDVHWLDEASGQLLGRLASGTAPIPVVVSTRTTKTQQDLTRWTGQHHNGAQTLDLLPLDFEGTIALVRASIGSNSPADGFGEAVYAQSAGNPLLICEICRMIGERRLPKAAEAPAPLSLAETRSNDATLLNTAKVTVIARTDQLPAEIQALLKIASAMGATFSVPELQALPPIRKYALDIEASIERLQAAHLIKPMDDRPGRFTFSHAVIRQAIYESMLSEQRREAHRAIAQAMEESGQPDNAENLPRILSHWERAGDARLAFNYLDRVAELRLRQFDNAAVVDLIERFFKTARELSITITPTRRAAACFLLGEASLNLGRAEAARNAYEEGLRLSGLPLPRTSAGLALHLVLDLAEQVWRRVTHGDKDWILEREISRSPSDPFLLAAKAHEDLTRIYYFTSEKLRLIHATLRATNLAERNKYVSPTTATNYASLGAICGVIPLHKQAEHYSRLAAALSERVDQLGTRVRVDLLSGMYQIGIGHWREGKQAFEAGLNNASTVGDLRRWCEVAVGLETISGPWLLTSAFEGIAPWEILVQRICEEGRRRGDTQVLGCGLLGRLRGHAALGRWNAIEADLDELKQIITAKADGLELVHCIEGASLLAEAARRQGKTGEAKAWFERAFSWCQTLNPAMKTRTLPALARLFDVASDPDSGDPMAAQLVLRKLERFARVYPIGRPAAALGEATLHVHRGQQRRAERVARYAFAEAIRLEMPAVALASLHHPAGRKDVAAWQALETMFAVRQNTWSEVLQLHQAEPPTHVPIVAFEGGHA
ncbi:AAA family ATPase [Ensifer adhaerens]|uniref:AAA family ATPase n=1 Tax=Ensifer adhaerens TaxID=106592 RepID=UPI001CBEECFD|nr:AAA family ATPase [Ensifer adhaerens]MBZ7926957.1 AAA family ATPase [Ensifer adhaerens]UAX96736.1 AAA family ATPase [Ensifer adhaerens]UAY03920.1 AAA family ATPase [Ensifer adhaerens]UAY11906.1 AAA family ATPase [Ensifer adhaerens]